MTLLLDLPLKTSLVPTVGSGSATFTRATTKNVFDNEGKLISIKSGAIGFSGARCVQNLFNESATLATQSVAVIARSYTVSFYGTGTITFSGAYAGADLVGTGISDRVQRTFTATAGTLTCTVTGSCTNAQLENVTGQADQTASEYVDSATDYGCGTVGIRFFNTHKDGSMIEPSALRGADLDPDSKNNGILSNRDLTTNFWRPSGSGDAPIYTADGSSAAGWNNGVIFPGTVVSTGNELQVTSTVASGCVFIDFPTTIGVKYLITYNNRHVSGAGSTFAFCSISGEGSSISTGQSTTSATYKRGQIRFTATATTTRLILRNSAAGAVGAFNSISITTIGIDVSLTATGIDGLYNSASRVTALIPGCSISHQVITTLSGSSGAYVKRVTGSGKVYFSRDDGASWFDITDSINSNDYSLVKLENRSDINPVIAFALADSGDVIDIDACTNVAGSRLCEPIFTETASVTRTAESLTYQTASNFSDTAGTILATFTPLHSNAWPSGAIVGKADSGLLVSPSNTGVQAADSTNTVSGATGAPANSSIRIGCRWSGSSLAAFSADPLLNVGAAGSYDGGFDLSTIAINPGAAGYIKDVKVYDTSLSNAEIKTAWSLLDSQTFLPAFSNLPIYKAGAIIHVEPDPPPVDPEPTPIFATNFVGITMNETNPYTDGSLALANFEFTGTDSSTGFVLPPTSPPIDTMSIYTGGQFPLGVQALSSMSGYVPGLFPSSNYAGVSNKVTILNGTETIRGVSQNTLKMTLKAPGAINDFNRQMWFAFRRDTVIDMPANFTVRYEVKVPAMTWDNLYLNFEGPYCLFDIKDSSDYRYFLTIIKSAAGDVGWKLYADRNSINNYGSAQWTPATPTNSRFFTLYNYTTPVPQEEFFTLEYSRTCPNNKDDATNGRFRVRIRTEADGVTEFTTIFDVSASSLAAHNVLNGTNYQNRHRSPTTNSETSYIHRIMHGLYGRFQNVDMSYEIAKFRIFDSFNI